MNVLSRRPQPPSIRLALAAFLAVVILGVWYRLRLVMLPLGALPETSEAARWLGVFSTAYEDVFVALFASCVILLLQLSWWGLKVIVFRFRPLGDAVGVRYLAKVLALLGVASLLLLVSTTFQTSAAVWQSMRSPLTYGLVLEGTVSGFVPALLELTAALSLFELFYIFSPLLVFALFYLLPIETLRYQTGLAATLGVAVVGLGLLPSSMALPQEEGIKRTPLFFVLRDTLRTWQREIPVQPSSAPMRFATKQVGGRLAKKKLLAVQANSVSFVDPMFVTSVKPQRALPGERDKEQWNVVVMVMESTGLRYIYQKERNRYPMPFLLKLAKEGLSLRNHFAPGNTSPRTVFSLFSGLYPMPNYRIYAMRKKLAYPSLFSLADKSYDSFLVTPGSLKWYFPLHYFKAKGPKRLYGFSTMKVKKAPKPARARDERASVGFFLKKLRATKGKPFIGVYYSFVAHWPYPDFGKSFHRYPPSRKVYRYLNNLYLLDKQIERIYATLREMGVAKKTIFVAVGDHGEAFGQHKNNWTHSRHSYNENYQTPMIFHQPRLFNPREVMFPTTHVDVLPTLLDAMNVRYNAKLVQGESLFQDVMRRKYVFLYGNEDTLSSVSQQGVKLQIAFKKHKCWVYDLKADPNERRRLSCKKHRVQYRATLAYLAFQRKLLPNYNRAARANQSFFGQSH